MKDRIAPQGFRRPEPKSRPSSDQPLATDRASQTADIGTQIPRVEFSENSTKTRPSDCKPVRCAGAGINLFPFETGLQSGGLSTIARRRSGKGRGPNACPALTPGRKSNMDALRQQDEPQTSAATIGSPFKVRTRAEFCEWGTALAARLGVPYPVADAALSKEYWGVVSQTVGIRLNMSDIETVSPRHYDLITNSLGILLHEIAHPLTVAMATVAPPTCPPEEAAAIVATWADRTEPVDDPPWDDHRADFIRTALHVHRRAERLLNMLILEETLTEPARYGLSSIYDYCAALGSEPDDLLNEPFTTIRATRPPRPFIELWKADVDRWYQALSLPTPSDVAARDAALTLFS